MSKEVWFCQSLCNIESFRIILFVLEAVRNVTEFWGSCRAKALETALGQFVASLLATRRDAIGACGLSFRG